MKYIYLLSLSLTAALALAGGKPSQVPFPADYKQNWTLYSVQNRLNNKQTAHLYANQIAADSIRDGGVAADGSIIVMEIYKAMFDAAGKPVAGADGRLEEAGLAAIAVMEKRADWGAAYPAAERAGEWGFAFYGPQGKPKDNDLDCVACHRPLAPIDYLFTHSRLAGESL